jgi:hypothetical protein
MPFVAVRGSAIGAERKYQGKVASCVARERSLNCYDHDRADGDGCVVTIVHEMAPEWAAYVEKVEGGWSRMLRAIDRMM